jgi:hypothetical protein
METDRNQTREMSRRKSRISQYRPSCERDIKGVLNFGIQTSDVYKQLLDRIVSINRTSNKFLLVDSCVSLDDIGIYVQSAASCTT